MKEQFVTYEIASKLKELGFDEECLAYYGDNVLIFDKHEYLECDIKANYILGWKNQEIILSPLWQQAIPFINNLLLKSGYEKHFDCYIRTDFSDLKQIEDNILSSVELITPKQ